MKNFTKKFPIPIAGLMLALAATGNLVSSYGTIYRNILGLISIMILILLTIKFITNTSGVVKELENPVVASVFPTFTMGMMLISTYLKPYASELAFSLWSLGIVCHGLLIIWFTIKYIFNFNIKKVFPSYFIVYVGIVVGSITAPAYGLPSIGTKIFWFGFISYLCLLPMVIYRVFVIKSIPEPAIPTLTIFAAPASLCLAGYLSSVANKDINMIGFLSILSLIMFLGVILYLPKMLKLKFYPSYSAFTFPMTISAIAMKKTYGYLSTLGTNINGLNYLVKFQEILTVIIVLYVLIKYIQFIFKLPE